MTSNSGVRWIRLGGVAAIAALIFASLLLPPEWEELRTGHWAVEHFLAYFAATSIVCLGWRRPFVVAGLLMPFAALLEALQYFTPTHTPDPLGALSGAGGALAAALIATCIIRVKKWGRSDLPLSHHSVKAPAPHLRQLSSSSETLSGTMDR